MCDKGSHPFSESCPHAHKEEDIREVSGYLSFIDMPSQKRIERVEEQESEEKPLDQVAQLPPRLGPKKKGKMKKSVSMNVTGPGGMEAALQTPKKQNRGKNKKRSRKSNKSTLGKSTDAI